MTHQLPCRLAVYMLCILMLSSAFVRTSSAAIVTTAQVVAASQRADHLQRIERALANEQLRSQLAANGVEPRFIEQRLAALSDAELVSLADTLEKAPAGGELLGLLGVIFVVLLVLELVGVTDVFKSVGSARR